MMAATIEQRLTELAAAKPLGATFAMKLTDGETWYIQSETTTALATIKELPNVATTFKLATADLEAMLDKKLNPTQAFMSGRMEIKGDMSVAMKIAQVLA